MKFEYDQAKSKSNLHKHGVDFETAKLLWAGPSIELAANQMFENRFAIIGPIGDKIYTCIYTFRGQTIRLISCRRAHDKEIKLYEEKTKKS